MLRTGDYHFESWGTRQDAGDTALLQAGAMTIVVTSRPVYLFDRSLFLAHGCDPQLFELVVVKSPHCQERFFTAWADANFNIDAPGSTSANLREPGAHRLPAPHVSSRRRRSLRAAGRGVLAPGPGTHMKLRCLTRNLTPTFEPDAGRPAKGG